MQYQPVTLLVFLTITAIGDMMRFYSDALQQTLMIQETDGIYTIDGDGDGSWDSPLMQQRFYTIPGTSKNSLI